MKIEVRNYRGIERGEITVDPIALLAGANYQGKTSLCQAVAATLSGHPVPFIRPSTGKGNPWSATVAKADAGILVRTGADRGSCTIKKDDDNQAVTVWPQADLATTGQPPRASVFASGLMTENNVWQLFALNDKQRASFFSDLLKAEPAYEDLSDALGEHDISKKSIDKVWEGIETNGWDAVHNSMVEHGTKLKGQWEGATGDNYGSKKGAQWIPDGWQDNLQEASEDGLNAVLVKAKEALEDVVGKVAVGDDERARLEKESHYEGPTLKAAEKAFEAAKKYHANMVSDRDALLPVVGSEGNVTVACPHCAEPIMVKKTQIDQGVIQYSLEIPMDEHLSKDEINKRRLDIADADGKVKKAEGTLTTAGHEFGKVQGDLEKVTEAGVALEGLSKGQYAEEAVDNARQTVAIATDRLLMFGAYNKARALHQSVKRNQTIIDTLAPTGLRKKVLQGTLNGFNKHLNALSVRAGWGTVKLSEDLQPRYGDRAFMFISDSEKYRVRATLQVAIAGLDKSDMIVLDGADILGKQGRNGLMKLLVGAKIPALVSMTIDAAGTMPDLPKEMGVSYWVEGGLVRPLKEVR